MSDSGERYSGKVTPVGNSKGIRLDSAFFKAHPEFEGEVLANGEVLLSARRSRRRTRAGGGEDPVVLGFLRFLEARMAAQPDQIVPADAQQLARIRKLVKGVKTA